MAKAQCDCYQPDGTCSGITVNEKLQPTRFRPENSKCLLVEPIKRCQHFESSVLPYRPDDRDSRLAANKQANWNEGGHTYRIATGYMAATVRLCPQCKESKIGEGRKLCDKCKAENRRNTKSESDRKRNAESDSHSSAKTDVDSQ